MEIKINRTETIINNNTNSENPDDKNILRSQMAFHKQTTLSKPNTISSK